ncbi:hydroxyethylthiazole kinase [Actinomyces radicidentis]|uniref:Hydroxyethylthiazole kinase n=1 Tax=Actinomyces radicidentis TaxID=111015 RepID=A0A0X8JFV4_ACTRD|nr:hydroxyethylthiazole kinase [Actinomyces radicidentis]AMD88090.1 hydroxyethylthiazole kinase [Actinomyces radicidentis]
MAAPYAVRTEVLEALRAAPPLVQCLTNSVVTNVTANVLLAAGAAPAMVDITGEAGPFAAVASAVLVNLGTPQPEQRLAAVEAVAAAREAGTPWVLDPVAIGALTHRTGLARRLVREAPTVVRGNASEIIALAGLGEGGRGPETSDDVEGAREAALAVARTTRGVVAVSGPVDLITDGTTTIRVGGGSPLLTRMTGGGCALGALIGAFVAASRTGGAPTVTDLDAVVACHAFYSAAAERAAALSDGPGSFQPALLDALYALGPEALALIPVSEEEQ